MGARSQRRPRRLDRDRAPKSGGLPCTSYLNPSEGTAGGGTGRWGNLGEVRLTLSRS